MFKRSRRAIAAVWVCVVGWGAGACSSDESGNRGCRIFCDRMCMAAAACGLTVSRTCADDCASQLEPSRCSNLPLGDLFSCDLLAWTVECTNYCATVCHRAPMCGSFDEKLCAMGCGDEQPTICNPASVAARSCDQLKPELQLYQEAATEGILVSAGIQSGVCSNDRDCRPRVCDLTTNTCTGCKSNADCGAQMLGVVCAPDGTCVECVVDSDCTHELFDKCRSDRHTCVECFSDADCSDPSSPHCDTSGICRP